MIAATVSIYVSTRLTAILQQLDPPNLTNSNLPNRPKKHNNPLGPYAH